MGEEILPLMDAVKRRVPTWLLEKRSHLTADQKAQLEQMSSDNSKSRAPFMPSPMLWSWLNNNLVRQMHIDGVWDPENSVMNHWFSAQLPGHKKYYFYALWNLYCRLRPRDTHGIFDRVSPSANGNKGVSIEVDGKLLSWDFLVSVMTTLTLLEADPTYLTEPKTILEIGAGWGRLGHLLVSLNPRITYLVADIPGTLLVAQSYLGRLFPAAQHVRYAQVREMSSIDARTLGAGFAFIGTHHLPLVEDGSVDLAINIASFQEMEKTNVALYFAEMRRLANACYILERTVADEVNTEDYIEMARSVGWSQKLQREPEFAPRYFETLFTQ